MYLSKIIIKKIVFAEDAKTFFNINICIKEVDLVKNGRLSLIDFPRYLTSHAFCSILYHKHIFKKLSVKYDNA